MFRPGLEDTRYLLKVFNLRMLRQCHEQTRIIKTHSDLMGIPSTSTSHTFPIPLILLRHLPFSLPNAKTRSLYSNPTK
jgi:hypothetical protein